MMRTTITIEPDVASQIERRRRERGTSLKHEVNELLRAGLNARQAPPAEYQLPEFELGETLVPIDDVHGALAIAEGDDYR